MKKLIAAILTAVLVFGLCACGSDAGGNAAETTEGKSDTFLAGYGRADITPMDASVPMGGYGDSSRRMSTGLLSYLYANTVAVRDGEGNTAVLVSVDMCSMSMKLVDEIRTWAQKELGIPKENIIISSRSTMPQISFSPLSAILSLVSRSGISGVAIWSPFSPKQ